MLRACRVGCHVLNVERIRMDGGGGGIESDRIDAEIFL